MSPNIKVDINNLFANVSVSDRARLLAVSAPHSSDWLHTLPLSSCGLRLNNEDIHVAVGLCLGTALCEIHLCPCGTLVDANGLHGLSCKSSSVKHARYANINDLVYHTLRRAEISTIMEPTDLSKLMVNDPSVCHYYPGKQANLFSWMSPLRILWLNHTLSILLKFLVQRLQLPLFEKSLNMSILFAAIIF